MPKGRTALYTIWRACVKLGMLPPGVKAAWDENTPYYQAEIIVFSQICDFEDGERLNGIVRL